MQELTEIVQLVQPHYKMWELNEIIQLAPYYQPIANTLGNLAQFYKKYDSEIFMGVLAITYLFIGGCIRNDIYKHNKNSKK